MGHTCSVVVFLSQRRCTDGSYVRYGLGADACPRQCDKCMPFQQFSAHSSWIWVSFRPHREVAFLHQTSFRKDPHFEHVEKTLKNFQSFLRHSLGGGRLFCLLRYRGLLLRYTLLLSSIIQASMRGVLTAWRRVHVYPLVFYHIHNHTAPTCGLI